MKTTQIRMHETGGTDVLKYEVTELPDPKSDEVLVKVNAVNVGFGEVLYRMGLYVHETKTPGSLGNCAVGTILALPDGLSEITLANGGGTFQIGDKIAILPAYEMGYYPVYGKHAIVPQYALAPYFDQYSTAENAGIWMQFLTAYGAILKSGVRPGDTVLVIPGSGSVGQAILTIANRLMGITTIATTRSQSKVELLRQAGADHVVVTNEEDLEARVLQITDNKGVQVAFNAFAGDVISMLTKNIVAREGTILMFGGIGGHAQTDLPFVDLIGRGIAIIGYTLYQDTFKYETNLPGMIEYVVKGVNDEHFKPNIDKLFDFQDIVATHDYITAGSTNGAVILKTE